MLYVLLLNFNVFIKNITVLFSLYILVLILYLMGFLINYYSKNIKNKNIILLKNLAGLESLTRGLRYLIYGVSIILALCSIYMYSKFKFDPYLVSYLNNIISVNYDEYRALYSMVSKGNHSRPIEYLQDSIGFSGMLIVNFYRTLYILYESPFPIILKIFSGTTFGILIKITSCKVINLFGSKNENMSIDGYSLEGLFNQYNLCLNVMMLTILLVIILSLVEYN